MTARVIGTRRSTMNKRRKGALSVIVPWLRRFGILTAVLVFGVWLGAWLYLTGNMGRLSEFAHEEMLKATAAAGFKVENILVEGRAHADANILKQLSAVEKGAPLFAFNPSETKAKIESMDWVKHATVERRLPDTIYIHLEEHTPIALWQKDKNLQLLNDEGGVIREKKLSAFKNLVIVMGEDAPQNAPTFLADLNAEPELAARAASARRVDGRRWDLVMKNGLKIKLPETDEGLALSRLAAAQREDKIFEKDITEIDMREADRIVLKTRPGAIEEYRARAVAAPEGNI